SATRLARCRPATRCRTRSARWRSGSEARMRTVLFLDLDDTIFQTRPKCPVGEPVRPAAFRRDGTPLSFMTDRQRALLDVLSRAATVIPTTARSLDAFRRVDLAFGHAAILDFGGVVLTPGGELD